MTLMDVPQLIEGLKKIHGSYGAAARACGMPEATMTKLRRGESANPRLNTLALLARGYGKPLIVYQDDTVDTHDDRDENGA